MLTKAGGLPTARFIKTIVLIPALFIMVNRFVVLVWTKKWQRLTNLFTFAVLVLRYVLFASYFVEFQIVWTKLLERRM